jgi:hypothetical protein
MRPVEGVDLVYAPALRFNVSSELALDGALKVSDQSPVTGARLIESITSLQVKEQRPDGFEGCGVAVPITPKF